MMVTTRRVGRWILLVLVFCFGSAILFRLGIGIYLSTNTGKEMVARQIGSRIGMPVEVHSIRLGLRSSSLSISVFDPNLNHDKGEVFAIESASTDLSLFDILRGRFDPTTIDLNGMALTLRVDAKGKVLTSLPAVPQSDGEVSASFPTISLTGSRISIQQEGRPEFTVNNLDLKVTAGENAEIQVSGSIDDSEWSKWTVSGNINRSSKTGWVELATDDGPLTMNRLSSVPFVPPSVWAHVRPDGRGAIDVRLTQSVDQQTRYEVNIKPSSANLILPDANATLQKVTGLIRVAGVKVELQGTRAELAGGTLSVDGGFDFGSEITAAKLKVAAQRLDIQHLPEEWGLPRDIQGKLRGDANLAIRIHPDGRIEPQGGGSGTIEDAKIRDIPVSIALKLVSNGKQYRFENADATPKAAPKIGALSLLFNYNVLYLCACYQPDKKEADPPKKDEPPTSLDANVKLRGVEISELLEKLNVKLGYKISGKVSAEVAMSVPLLKAVNQDAYRFTGKLSSPALQLEGLIIRDLSATVVYQDGKLSLTELVGKIEQPGQAAAQAGKFHGTAVVERDPPGKVKMNFSFERIPLGEVFKAIPGWSIPISGTVAGKAEFNAPYAKLSDTASWSASAELNAPELVVAGRTIKDLQVRTVASNGEIKLKDTKVTVEGIPVTAEASLTLNGKYAFSATAKTTATSVTDLRKLIPEVELPVMEGVLETDTNVTGTASPFTFNAKGRIAASKLTLAKSTANQIEVNWQVTPERLIVSELKASLFGGTITGSADIPFSRDRGGKFDLVFKSVGAESATAFVPDFPVQISGQVSGKVSGKLAPAKPGESRIPNMDIDLAAPKLTVQGIPADQLIGKAAIKSGVFEYRLEGKTLGGSFEVKGSYPSAKTNAPDQTPGKKSGSFKLTGLDLSRLAPVMGIQSLVPLHGRVDASFDFNDVLSTGSGRVTVADLKWGNSSIARELTGVLMLREGILHLSETTGRLAGGEVRATAQINLKDTRRNSFTFSLRGADSRRLFAVVPELAQKIDGPITLVARGHIGREMRGSGTLSLSQGTISGVPVADLRIPFDWAMSPGGYGRFAIREATVNTGTGKMEATAKVEWGFETRVEGQVRFLNVPLRTIVPELGSMSLVGNGRITGRFDLSGNHVRSIDDVNGSLFATFTQTSVKEVPILQQTVPFLNAAGLAQPFQSGDVRGTLSGGVFRVQRLALVNTEAQVFAQGAIGLTGRLDGTVVAHTGLLGPANRAFRLFGLRLPAFGPIPLTLLAEVSDFLSNRTIRMTITGTTKDPIVRVNTAALLSEEAVRFFLARYILPASASEALGLGLESGSFGKR